MEITLGSEVILKARLAITWTVSYIEGTKLYCYRAGNDQQVSSIVVDASLSNVAYVVEDIGDTIYPSGLCRVVEER